MWSSYRKALQPRADLRDILRAPPNRIPVLDGVRAIGILLVIALHCCFGLARLLPTEKRQAFINSLPSFLDIFWQARGSDIIFILCGLLVSWVLFREMDHQQTINIKAFYRKRILRIIPLYWLALLLYMLTDVDLIKYLLSNLLFVTNLLPKQRNIIPVGWSMETQVHFYLLLPFFVLWLARRQQPLLWIGLTILAAVAIRYVAVQLHPRLIDTPFHVLFDNRQYSHLYSGALYYKLPTRLGPFLMGIAVAWIWHYRPPVLIKTLKHPLLNFAVLLLGILLVQMALSIGIHNPADAFYHPFNEAQNIQYMVLNSYQFCLGVCLIILCALFPAGMSHALTRVLSVRCWHPVSELVYGLYLFHFLAIMLAAVMVFGSTDKETIISLGANVQTFLALFAIAVPLSLLIASLTYVFIEKPFIRLEQQHS